MSAHATAKIDPRVQILGALLAARLAGCTCSPEIAIKEMAPGVCYAEIAHDAWCSHPSQRKGKDA